MAEQQRNPFRGFLDMASEMNRMRNIGTYGQETGQEDRERTHATAWVPTVDVFAKGQDLVIRMELAGVAPQDIDVSFHENTLTVSSNLVRSFGICINSCLETRSIRRSYGSMLSK